ncbi:MAG: acyltransferase [Candidatus Omnitrophica bacterium]|nr:acyltransferase [Candidatus Omnitrophota bacterium]
MSLYGKNFKNETYIHPTAEVFANAKIGRGTKIWNLTQLRVDCVVGKNCSLGKGVYIDCQVKIGNNVKIQNGVSVYRGVTIEDDVFIGPHAIFTNDLYPRSFHKNWQIVPTLIKKGASLGAGSVTICGNTVGKYAMVGAGSVITKDVPDHALVVGNPGRIIGFVCKCGHRLKTAAEKEVTVRMKCESCHKFTSISKKEYRRIREKPVPKK